MNEEVVIYGAGGHGKVVADAILCAGGHLLGFLDDRLPAGTVVLGHRVLGAMSWLDGRDTRVALGIGDNVLRSRIAGEIEAKRLELYTVIHPRAVIAPSAQVERGVVVFASATINADAVIGRGAIINTGAIVEHDCRIGEFAHVSPRAVLGGGCRVGDRAHLGIGAIMLPGRGIGDAAVVGGGATVVRDIGAGITAVGVPARPLTKLP